MSENAFLGHDVDLDHLAEITKNFSGAEIEGLVKDAAAYALNRNINFNDLHAALDEENIKVGGRGKPGGRGPGPGTAGGGALWVAQGCQAAPRWSKAQGVEARCTASCGPASTALHVCRGGRTERPAWPRTPHAACIPAARRRAKRSPRAGIWG